MRLCTAFHCIVLLTANKFLSLSLSVSSQSANVGETMRGDAALRANDTAYCWLSMSAASQSSYRWGGGYLWLCVLQRFAFLPYAAAVSTTIRLRFDARSTACHTVKGY